MEPQTAKVVGPIGFAFSKGTKPKAQSDSLCFFWLEDEWVEDLPSAEAVPNVAGKSGPLEVLMKTLEADS